MWFDFVGAKSYRMKGAKDSKPASFINTAFVLKLKKDPEPWAPKLILLRLLESIKVRYLEGVGWGGEEKEIWVSIKNYACDVEVDITRTNFNWNS
jgi:hypothetical protein